MPREPSSLPHSTVRERRALRRGGRRIAPNRNPGRPHRARGTPPRWTTTSCSASSASTLIIATLAAAGGLRELLDDPDDTVCAPSSLPAEHRARVHALHELHARWMEAAAAARRRAHLAGPHAAL